MRLGSTLGAKAPFFCQLAKLFISLGFLLLLAAANPFGLRTASDRESEDIVFRLIAPLYGHTEARENITVLLLTDRDLDYWDKDWPLHHGAQGDVLFALQAVDPGPSALFYDFLFSDEREHTEYFAAALKNFGRKAPVLLAALTNGSPRASEEHYGILPPLAENAELVAVQWSGHGRAYPLWVKAADGRWHMTPAMRLYQIYCKSTPDSCPHPSFFEQPPSDDEAPPAISIVWGGRASQWQTKELPNHVKTVVGGGCTSFGEGRHLVEAYGRLIYRGLVGDTSAIQPCFYHDAVDWRIAFDDTFSFFSPDLSYKLNDRIVLVGARLDAIQDEKVSPVHGKIPGVLHHAMALDNLITMGAAYLRYPPDILLSLGLDDLIEILLLLLLLAKASQVRAVRERGSCWSIHTLLSRTRVDPARASAVVAAVMAAAVAGLAWCTSRATGGPDLLSGALLALVGVGYALLPPNMDGLALVLARPRLGGHPRAQALAEGSLIAFHILAWMVLIALGVALPPLLLHQALGSALQWYMVLFLGLSLLLLLLPLVTRKKLSVAAQQYRKDWLVPAVMVQGVVLSALIVAVTSMTWRLSPINWLAIIAISFVVLPVADLFRDLFDRLCLNCTKSTGVET